jgi:gamma-glutamyltranspeptidase/glutathione hydrolase
MFALDPSHPNALAPFKRPRTTLSPSLALLPDGRRMAFGTPGGDQQDQWALHFFLALVDFGVSDLQQAIDAPTLHSVHMPSSFHPHFAQPGTLVVEERVAADVVAELARRGHRIQRSGPWDHGRMLAVTHAGGRFEAAASPRFEIAYAAVLP